MRKSDLMILAGIALLIAGIILLGVIHQEGEFFVFIFPFIIIGNGQVPITMLMIVSVIVLMLCLLQFFIFRPYPVLDMMPRNHVCAICGFQIEPYFSFCPKCGAPLRNSNQGNSFDYEI